MKHFKFDQEEGKVDSNFGGGLKWLLNWNSGPFTFRIGIYITNAVVRNYQLAFDWFQLINKFTTIHHTDPLKEYKICRRGTTTWLWWFTNGIWGIPAQPEICVVVTRSIEGITTWLNNTFQFVSFCHEWFTHRVWREVNCAWTLKSEIPLIT